MNSRDKFIASAKKNKILANKCSNCGHTMLETVNYCEKCFSSKFESIELEGIGKVVTYTIQAVAPEGFEDVESYAWVVFKVDGASFRVSGFLPGIATPKDLPIGTTVKVSGFDPKHGLLLQKV
jgi:uncharacterized OB-fold protein